jgi:hypothetical protein
MKLKKLKSTPVTKLYIRKSSLARMPRPIVNVLIKKWYVIISKSMQILSSFSEGYIPTQCNCFVHLSINVSGNMFRIFGEIIFRNICNSIPFFATLEVSLKAFLYLCSIMEMLILFLSLESRTQCHTTSYTNITPYRKSDLEKNVPSLLLALIRHRS